jgi:hypothetical protein
MSACHPERTYRSQIGPAPQSRGTRAPTAQSCLTWLSLSAADMIDGHGLNASLFA